MPDALYQVPLDRVGNDPITEGVHPFTIVGFNEGEGNAGPYWKFDCRCDTPSENQKMAKPLFLSLSPQSRWKFEIFLDAVGAPPKGMATADKFVGRRFRGKVEHETYEGRVQAAIKETFPLAVATTVTPTVVPGAAAKKVTVKSTAKKEEAPKQPELPADATDGDIPAGF
jgi:hypothetical protein